MKGGSGSWSRSRSSTPVPPPAPRRAKGLCFTRTEDGKATLLSVSFLSAEDFSYDGYTPGPEFASGAGYRLETTSDVPGTFTTCEETF
ncbi:hypothetical protein [Streptomyces stackebrandtii]|uniref:hypothetical protein n=1 Tax=Streptomyces stackebrandtii TaxID=3051177 RepID=UPI0028DBD31A|nr:hypothetical protein [Streptomyces sp. DSM 40976]